MRVFRVSINAQYPHLCPSSKDEIRLNVGDDSKHKCDDYPTLPKGSKVVVQSINAALQAELDKGQIDPIVLIDLYEFYPNDYIPGVGGFDPADAIQTFAAQEIVWNGATSKTTPISGASSSPAVALSSRFFPRNQKADT